MELFGDPRFAPLRNMEAFTDDMFNRIVAFQEKKHAAWNSSLSFDQRIAGLPLHYLVFSNPDRDPTRMGPTVATYYPLREELRAIAHLVRQVAVDPIVWDVHPGSGFIGTLLAREGLRVIGTRDPAARKNQIADFYDPAFYDMRETAPENFADAIDVAFSSWMPSGRNFTPTILAKDPKLVIFIYTEHQDDQGRWQTGTPEAFADLPDSYSLVAEWEILRPENLFKEIWPDLTGNPEELRKTRVFARRDMPTLDLEHIQSASPYSWEDELNMALLAHDAKQALQQRGVPG